MRSAPSSGNHGAAQIATVAGDDGQGTFARRREDDGLVNLDAARAGIEGKNRRINGRLVRGRQPPQVRAINSMALPAQNLPPHPARSRTERLAVVERTVRIVDLLEGDVIGCKGIPSAMDHAQGHGDDE